MKLSRKEFEILVAMTENEHITQRFLAEKLDYSVGTINKTVKSLENEGLINNGNITEYGYMTLEDYRAKRAVFIAAGFGSRMVPVTLNTPKPLVRVNGTRIIDTLIDACLNAGIEEIYIVRGYLGDQFDQLLIKYPMIKFLDNPSYNESNNIGSALIAKDLMEQSYVFEADLLLSNKSIVKKYNYRSNVLGIYKDITDDWCLETDKDDCVIEEKIGGTDCYQMVGIYYFNSEDGKKLSSHIEKAYAMPGGKERYWETVPNQVYKGQYRIEVRPCLQEDIVEIDTFKELTEIDKSYLVQG